MFRRKVPEAGLQPSWMIVGLGNPGAEYRGTRHNVGFDLIDRLGERHRIKLDRGRGNAQVGIGKMDDTLVALVKPLTFMNRSGTSVAALARQFSVDAEHVLVIADDLDLPVGALRIRLDGSAGGHNGHKSVIQALGTMRYPRIKIGIDANKEETVDHVLGRFKPDEKEKIDDALKASLDICQRIIDGNWNSALELVDKANKRNLPEE